MSDLEPTLLDAIAAEPENNEARLVMADYYLEQNDPRGELIVAQLRALAGDHVAAARAEDLLERHQKAWAARLLGPRSDACETSFARGFLSGLCCAPNVLTQLIPALTRLKPPITSLGLWETNDAILKKLVQTRLTQHLGQLDLSCGNDRPPTSAGLKQLSGMGRLQSLTLRQLASEGALKGLDSPSLTELSLEACAPDMAGLRALIRASFWGRLKRLSLKDCTLELGRDGGFSVLLQGLVRSSVRGLDMTGVLVPASELVGLARVTSLEELTVSAGFLDVPAGWAILDGVSGLKVLRMTFTPAAEERDLWLHPRVRSGEVKLVG